MPFLGRSQPPIQDVRPAEPTDSNWIETDVDKIATFNMVTLRFHDTKLQEHYSKDRRSHIATPLAVIMLFGCGGVWLLHCPKPNEVDLGGWYLAASLSFFIVYLLTLSVFIVARLIKTRVDVAWQDRLLVVEDACRNLVPVGGALTCSLLLLARSIENRPCTADDLPFLRTYACNPLAEEHTFPGETALVVIIVPPFMQVCLKLDRVTTFIAWLLCWGSLVASTAVLQSYNVNFWTTMCGSSIPVVLYEVERQAIVNYRLILVQRVLYDRAVSFRAKARNALDEVDFMEVRPVPPRCVASHRLPRDAPPTNPLSSPPIPCLHPLPICVHPFRLSAQWRSASPTRCRPSSATRRTTSSRRSPRWCWLWRR